MEPRLLVVTDPFADHQPVKEASFVNIPTIAFCTTDVSLRNVDVCIPANTRQKHSIALMYYLLAREVLRMRKEQKFDVMVDLFMYREPEEAEKQAKEQNQDQPDQGDQNDTQEADTFDNQADLQQPASSTQKIEWGADNEGGWQ